MTPVWYARCFLLAPLIVSFGVPAARPVLAIIPSEVLAVLLGYLVVGAWLARVPYAVFAVFALAFLWRRDAEAHFRLARIAPLAFLPFFGCYIYASEALGRTGVSLFSDAVGIASWSLITLPFGYVYVGLFFLGARVVFGTSRPESWRAPSNRAPESGPADDKASREASGGSRGPLSATSLEPVTSERRRMKRIARTSLVLGSGFIAGAVATSLLQVHVRPIYRDVMRANLVAQERLVASRAARAGDHVGAVLGFSNVVEAPSFRIFRRDWDADENSLVPWRLLVLGWMRGDPAEDKARQISEAMDRARLALALEALQQDAAASTQWELAARLASKSKDAMRRSAEMQAKEEDSELHRQAEAAILDHTHGSQAQQ